MWFLPLISHWEVAARVLIFCGHCFWSAWFALRCKSIFSLTSLTGGHFACSCVHPLNDSSVGASNLMAGNRKLVRKVTVFLKAISLVLWIPFLQKIFSMTKIERFLRGFSLVDFSAVGFLGLLKTFKTQRQKVMFLYKSDFHCQSNAFQWFDFQTRGFTYPRGNAS